MTEKIRVECPNCGGTGYVEHYTVVGDTDAERLLTGLCDCPMCQGGTGQIWDYPEDKEFDKYED